MGSTPDSVEAIVAELQRLSSKLREQHGLACAFLGKDGRVVVFDDAPPPSPRDEKDDDKSLGTSTLGTTSLGTLSTAPAIHPGGIQPGSPRAVGMDHFVSHEHADVVLKVCANGATKHLYASSETLARHSPYFEALFAHPFAEAQSRVVTLDLPCADALDATLFQLYTGQVPELLPHVGREGLTPDLFFGLLANAKFLLMEDMKRQCADFLAQRVDAGTHKGFTRHAHFGPDLFPASCMLHVLEHLNNGDLASLDLRKRLLETAFAWLEASVDEDSLHHILPASELAQVSDKCGRVVARLGFELLGELYAQSPRGFHKLMSLDAFLPALTALERTRKVNKCDVCQAVVPYCAKDTARCHRGLPYGNERHTFTGTWT